MADEGKEGGAAARPLALVTGASSGIGAAIAPLAAADGHDLVLVARRTERLEALRESLGPDRAVTVAADLAAEDGPDRLVAALADLGRPVDVLVNNAGFGVMKKVVATDPDELLAMVDVNVRAVVALTRALLPGMMERRRGGILNVASTAAFQPGPRMATYYASKAFVLSFSEALTVEAARAGVTVTALCPGPTRTEFQERGGMASSPLFRMMPAMTAEAVAAAGWRGFRRGRRVVVPGLFNRIGAATAPLVPRALLLPAVDRLNRPG